MNFEQYQKEARKTAIYPNPIIYPTLGLCGESGEVAEKVKKVLRDKAGQFDLEVKENIKKELGDILWYISNLADDLAISLDEVASNNLTKLRSRQERGVLSGSGDNR
jgi:NTP pyrophosphatase (non-canonical NTP hydrolase)